MLRAALPAYWAFSCAWLLMRPQTVEEGQRDYIEPRDTDIHGETVTVHVGDPDKKPAPPAVATEAMETSPLRRTA
ncbi:hypothetical protein ACPA9J_00085 [Pseudomonas aeruginosa]